MSANVFNKQKTTIYTNNDCLATFAFTRAANRVTYLQPTRESRMIGESQSQHSYRFYNTSGIIFNITSISAVIFAGFLPFALPIGSAGLLLGTICLISDVREYNSAPPPLFSNEQVRNLFARLHPQP